MMTKDEVITAVKNAADELGKAPSLDWLWKNNRVTKHAIRKHFGEFRSCLDSCGLRRHRQGYQLADKDLFMDWAEVTRQLGRVPSILDYQAHGRYSLQPMNRRYGSWTNLPAAMLECAQKEGLMEEWNDVLEVIAAHLDGRISHGRICKGTSGVQFRPRILKDEPIYGPPVGNPYLLLAPTNEQGVIFLFGAVARKLGFAVLRLQTEYPDGEALREIGPGQWQRIKLEFENESKNFLLHRHDPAKCHLIVCWKHNWPECPLEVIELESAIKNLSTDED